jgi:hypothetical protein
LGGAVPGGREGFNRIKPRANDIASPPKPEISRVRAQARFHSLAFDTESETAFGGFMRIGINIVGPSEGDQMATKAFIVDQEWKADAKVFFVDQEWKAQVKVFLVDQEWKAQMKIFPVRQEWKAQMKVFPVDAEWK